MNNSFKVMPLVLLAIGFFGAPAMLQAQTRIAIVDVGAIFKNHPRFNQQLELLKQQAEAFKATSIQEQQDLVMRAETASKTFKPGSPDYKAAESKLAQESAAMEVAQKSKMRDLMQQEAQLHFTVYQEVKQLVASISGQDNLQLVLRYNGKAMDPNDPTSIMQRVNGSVVYYRPTADITQKVISQIGRTASQSQPGIR